MSQDDHADQTQPEQTSPQETLSKQARKRRRLTKAALASGPVLMTLSSKPLMADTMRMANCHPSGWISANTSLQTDPVDCGGRTPGYWQGDASGEWGRGDKFNDEFEDVIEQYYAYNASAQEYVKATMEHAVQRNYGVYHDENEDDDDIYDRSWTAVENMKRQLIRFGAAALLNARDTHDYPLSEEMVKEIVTEVLNTGFYTTSTQVQLSAEVVKNFLENTMNTPSWGPQITL
ncbi:hypothetical protein [Ectothiorhodospira sp. BSL-9]|uniref:hypothetical protein n=1 Tax=Ectothiorhodospira sp. BSL-9 TaxID=1442136 RepID=UPI0007B43CD1|nr:hypothetical protein [Ectothiorhodospira sp. BSL-9]ANB02224.1 hypothetical protein ECTOBSL9_1565 [Ectothiorhodospira sp. BSL-9]